jgi:hypothetical protein
MPKNALDYCRELTELESLISSIEYSLDYADAAVSHQEDPASVTSMALSLAQSDLQKSHEKFKHQRENIIQRLSKIYP